MDELNIEHRLTDVENRAKSNTHRLDKLEPIVDEIHTMSNTMVQLVQEVKHTNETVNNLDAKVERTDSRVDDMERAPAKEWGNTKRPVINTIIGAIVGFILSGLMWAAVQAFIK